MDSNDKEKREQTLGEYRIGINFNPSGNGTVHAIKQKTAELIDLLDRLSLVDTENVIVDGETVRLFGVAMTAYEEAAMWAIKAVTKNNLKKEKG